MSIVEDYLPDFGVSARGVSRGDVVSLIQGWIRSISFNESGPGRATIADVSAGLECASWEGRNRHKEDGSGVDSGVDSDSEYKR